MSIYLTNEHLFGKYWDQLAPSFGSAGTARLGVSSHRGFFKHLPRANSRSSSWEAKRAITVVPKVDGSLIRVNGISLRSVLTNTFRGQTGQ